MNELNIDTYNISNNTKLIDLKDMSSLRTRLKELGQYNSSLDSLTYLEDGNDYGLGVKINNQVINYLPYLESEDKIIQYYYDSENRKCAIKAFNIDKDTYIENYAEKYKPEYFDYQEVNSKTSKKDLLKNFIIRYSYIANKVYDKKTSDNKIKVLLKKLENASYKEMLTNFNKTIEGIGGHMLYPTKHSNAGYTLIKSTSYFLIIFGILVCIISFILYILI